jgi:Cu(I)/Ag(I) efflux system membrane fusion protein
MTGPQGASVRKITLIGASVAALVLAAGAGGFWLGGRQMPAEPPASDAAGRRVLYWYDPMVPEQHFDRAGKSPFMDMQLVPRYADEGGEQSGVTVDPAVAQNLGIRYAQVSHGPLAAAATASGVIAFNERDVAIVQARAGGFVERGYQRAVGDIVARGAPLVDLRIPEWTAAQAEYLALRGGDASLAAAARQRLIMLGMPASLVARIESDGAPRPVFTVTAPIGGAITAFDARAGMTIAPGAALATINSVSPVWLVASIPQGTAGGLRRGATVVARLAAFPGETFRGRVESVLPQTDAASRSVELRIALVNADGRLRPGMTAQVEITDGAPRQALLIPAEAVIRTGERNVVIVAGENNRFAPVEVAIGQMSGDQIEVRSGLNEGQRIVASGQFLIDSEASLAGVVARLAASAPQADAAHTYSASGRITVVSAQSITIAHGPVAELSWPAMTMQFSFARPDLARGLSAGQNVRFEFQQGGAGYVVTSISAGVAP